uniref:Catalase n=1 Tax=Lygus hesperus TaxID=30085 RepID=A0A0A9Y1H7_LYGHE
MLKITGDITKYSSATMFQPGTQWNVTTRFSRISGEMGSQDTRRDTRGFAVKFYTDRGIWDLVSNNSPIFFIRDPMLFIVLVHSIMRNPQTHLLDPSAMWDFFSRTPQAVPQLLIQFSDYGIPLSYRHMDGFSIHAFTLVNSSGAVSYAKFRWRSNQGVKFLSNEQANSLASSNPDFYIEDLYNAIAAGNYPSWNLTAQILSPEQVANIPFYPFDATKDWNTTTYPEVQVGIMTLNQNPPNYFVGVETVAFDPGRLIPGIQPTVDRLLQGRMFAYTDAQVYRVGVNGNDLLRNRAMNAVNNYLRDGPGDYGNNQGAAVNYYPNSFNGPVTSSDNKLAPYRVRGSAGRYSTANDDNYSQGTAFYENVLSPDQRTRLINNLADSISSAYPFIQLRMLKVLCNVGVDLCERLAAALGIDQESTTTSTTGSISTTTYY